MITPGIQVQKALFHNDSTRLVTLVISIIYQIKSQVTRTRFIMKIVPVHSTVSYHML